MNFMLIIFFIAALLFISSAVFKKLQKESITEPFLTLGLDILVGPDVPEQKSSLANEFAKIKNLESITSSEKR